MGEGKARVYAIDLARGLAVFFMILVHVLITFSSDEIKASPFGKFIDFMGGAPAAPVFMAMMGTSLFFSRRSDFKITALRGLKIIALGYLLNFLRGVLPMLLTKNFLPSAYAQIPEAVRNMTDAFLEVDILQFAGLALIAGAFLKSLKLKCFTYLIIAAGVGSISPFLWKLGAEIPVVGELLNLLWGDKPSLEECVGNIISFPFFPWFSFVLAGMAMGEILTSTDNTDKVIRYAGITGFIILIPSWPIVFGNAAYHMNDYYHCRPLAVLMMIAFVFAWIWLCHLALKYIRMNKVFSLLFDWSKNVNSIYMIQWILIMFAADMLLGFDRYALPGTLAIMLALLIGTHYTDKIYRRFTGKNN